MSLADIKLTTPNVPAFHKKGYLVTEPTIRRNDRCMNCPRPTVPTAGGPNDVSTNKTACYAKVLGLTIALFILEEQQCCSPWDRSTTLPAPGAREICWAASVSHEKS